MKLFAFSFLFIVLATGSLAQISFQAPIHLEKIWNGQRAYSADFDNDGKMDLLHYSTNEVIVLYNNGSHDFTKSRIQISSDDLPLWGITLQVGDLNADGRVDFAVYTGSLDNHLYTFLSSGRAFTKTELEIEANIWLSELVIADLDNDGLADLVAASNTTSLYFFKGDGSGGFVPNELDAFRSMSPFLISDLNADGLSDIIGIHNSSEIDVYIGTPNGAFNHQATALGGSTVTGSTAFADFNGDNFQDVVTTVLDESFAFATNVYINDGNFNFTASTALTETLANYTTAIDFDHDGHVDLVGVSPMTGRLTTLRNNGDATFTSIAAFEKPLRYPNWMSVADFDRDGDDELVLAMFGQLVRVQDFVNEEFIDVEEEVFGRNPREVLSADMNQDGFKDLVVGNTFSNTIEILYGNEDHTFTAGKSFDVPSELWDLALADFNSDGFEDIAYACNEISVSAHTGVLLSTSAGNYVASTIANDVGSVTLHAADFDVDGNMDLIQGNYLYTNDGSGHFTSRTTSLSGNYTMGARDMNNDGFPDVIVSYGAEPKIAFNDGQGEFSDFTLLTEPEFVILSINIGDINNDELPDILIVGQSDNTFGLTPARILINKGDRSFETTELLVYYGNNASIADFNLDGRNDILTVNVGKTYIQLQDQNGGFTSVVEIVDNNFMSDFSGADDMNNDGKTDFYTYNLSGALNVIFNDKLVGPTIQPSALAIQGLSDKEVTATFHKGNGTGRLLLLRQNTGSDDVPADDVAYDFSSSFPSGATIGDGNHVVLTGDVTTVFISDLVEGTEYELVAFEYAENQDKTKINYNVTFPPSITFKTKKKQTITFGEMSIATFGVNPISIPVSASSGLPVTLAVSSGQATISGNQATPAQPGPLMLKASQPGNDEYMPAPNKEVTFCVFPPVPTISVNKDDPANPVLTSSATTNNQWQEDGTDIPGATNRTLEPEGNGLFSVKVSYAGCARTSLPTALVITEVNKEESFRMFPNPAVNQLTITLPGTEGITSLTMMDMHGRPVTPAIVIRGNTADINLDQLTEGIYLVQAAYGGSIFQGKVLKVK